MVGPAFQRLHESWYVPVDRIGLAICGTVATTSRSIGVDSHLGAGTTLPVILKARKRRWNQ